MKNNNKKSKILNLQNQNGLTSIPIHIGASSKKRGFTLIEMLVATALFSSVMLIGVSALLSLIDANKKAQALNSVMNNLNFAIESMSRNIRMGTIYHCEFSNSIPPPNITEPKDCVDGGKLLAFEPSGGNLLDPSDQIVYRINEASLERSENGGLTGTFINITAPEVTIEEFSFYVEGASPLDNLQPRVVMVIRGSIGAKSKIRTELNLQTMVSQRVLDL